MLLHHGFIEIPYMNEGGTEMKSIKAMLFILGVVFAAIPLKGDGNLTDDEEKTRIVSFAMLSGRLCGHALADFRNEFHERKLTNREWFDGDTNRLARLLCELAQTNKIDISSMMIDELGEYGTQAQLPFLYSCTTNPIIGGKAVKSILRIEGVTSNSVAALQSYLSFTNSITRQQAYDRAIASREFLDILKNSDASIELKSAGLQVVRTFAADINTSNSVVDGALVAADDTYRYSKRRLAVMRAAYPRCFNEYQTNYVANVIYELLDYPEVNLSD